MRAKVLLFLLSVFLYSESVYCAAYSCDVFKEKQKIATLPGSLNNSDTARFGANTQQTDPNTALAFTLCQRAGLPPVNVMMTIPGIRPSSSVTKSQLLPNPACTLQCTAL